jgi:hypothetical protein
MRNAGYLFSGIVVLLSAVIFSSRIMTAHTTEAVKLTQSLGILAVFRFKDTVHSRWVFVIDGVFLYLESYFWVISLFIIVRESFLRLSLVVNILRGAYLFKIGTTIAFSEKDSRKK